MKSTITVLLLLALAVLLAQGCARPVTSEHWREDLRQLERELAERHVDLYHSVSESKLSAGFDDLHERIPTLSTTEILVRIAQLTAMVGDGHTSFYPGDQKRWKFHYYPIQLYWFADGIYPTATPRESMHLLDKRLVQIDQTPIEQALEAISTTISADNDMEYRYTAPFELIRPELLHALGIAASADSATFVFDDGKRSVFHAMTADQWLEGDWRVSNGVVGPEKAAPSRRLELLFATSFTLPHLAERKYYWFEYLEDQRSIFLQYNACWDKDGDITFAKLIDDMFEFVDAHPVERIIIDVRQNTGGEPRIGEPLIEALEQRPEIGERGGLFVLVGRRTFSAALTNAAQLRARAGARVVGEAPRGKPNNPSEGRDIDLDRTGTWATVSTQFVERDAALGDADYLPVDIPASYSFDIFRQDRDPMLEAALEADLYVVSP